MSVYHVTWEHWSYDLSYNTIDFFHNYLLSFLQCNAESVLIISCKIERHFAVTLYDIIISIKTKKKKKPFKVKDLWTQLSLLINRAI